MIKNFDKYFFADIFFCKTYGQVFSFTSKIVNGSTVKMYMMKKCICLLLYCENVSVYGFT